jgi:hypothetical protein
VPRRFAAGRRKPRASRPFHPEGKPQHSTFDVRRSPEIQRFTACRRTLPKPHKRLCQDPQNHSFLLLLQMGKIRIGAIFTLALEQERENPFLQHCRQSGKRRRVDHVAAAKP